MNPTSRQWQTVLALGGAQTLAWGSTYYLPAMLAAPMARDLGLATGTVYAAFSAALVAAAVLGPVAGRRIDRFGGRSVLALSNLVFAAGLALLGSATGATQLFSAWLVIGVGMAVGLYEAAFSTLARLYGNDARSAITGVTLIAGFASTVCWPVSAWLDAEFGWRTACFAWAAVHLVVGLPLNGLLVPTIPKRGAPDSVTAPPVVQAPASPRDATMPLLAFVFAAAWFTSTAMAAHLPGLLQEAGMAPVTAIAIAALVGPAQVAGRLLEFGALRHFHPLLSARLAAIAHPIGAAAMLGIGAPAATSFALLHGAGNGVMTIAKGTLPLAMFGPAGYGFRQGVLMVPARFAQAAAPFLFALLIERYGVDALLLTATLGLVAFAALLYLTPSSRVASP